MEVPEFARYLAAMVLLVIVIATATSVIGTVVNPRPATGRLTRGIDLSHGWPLCSDSWQNELKLFADAGYRTIAHDRRGHGRSAKTHAGNDMETYARDLAELIDSLDLHEVILIGHSMGGGEVVKYAAEHGEGRVAKIITAGGVPPIMVKSDSNPDGTPIEVFDRIREGVLKDRSQFYKDLSGPFFGANREGSKVSQGVRDDFWRQGNAGQPGGSV